ncbi:MAG: hypothetical protein WBJ45_09455 [Limnohabitans sp.]|uniref:hypothetical protein n=1 Tax=Limnohabitans sp. TaxID=1907725 RepID=UPI003BB170EA
MFGLFKKPDSKKTTNECLEVWDMLTDRDKQSSAQNILKYAIGLSQQCTTGSEALLAIGQLKQNVIHQFGLRDHVHPAYMQLQILSDYIFSHQQGLPEHAYARFALEKITATLNQNEKSDLFNKLAKFL